MQQHRHRWWHLVRWWCMQLLCSICRSCGFCGLWWAVVSTVMYRIVHAAVAYKCSEDGLDPVRTWACSRGLRQPGCVPRRGARVRRKRRYSVDRCVCVCNFQRVPVLLGGCSPPAHPTLLVFLVKWLSAALACLLCAAFLGSGCCRALVLSTCTTAQAVNCWGGIIAVRSGRWGTGHNLCDVLTTCPYCAFCWQKEPWAQTLGGRVWPWWDVDASICGLHDAS
jgi:hypothetical protein